MIGLWVFMPLLTRFLFVMIGVLAWAHVCIADEASIRNEFRKPDTITFPENAPYSPQVAALGKKLFFDPRLSGAQNMSCASCHNPSLDGKPLLR